MQLYFDMNIYNRVFDDQNQFRIKLETTAILSLFELIEKGKYALCWSFMLEFENANNPFSARRLHIQKVSAICSSSIEPSSEILDLAKQIMEHSNSREKDAIHLACALYSNCDYFITCDDLLIKTINRNISTLKPIMKSTKLINPVDFLRKEMNLDDNK
jgi:predicted nucleic acid-binding protein